MMRVKIVVTRPTLGLDSRQVDQDRRLRMERRRLQPDGLELPTRDDRTTSTPFGLDSGGLDSGGSVATARRSSCSTR